MNDYLNAKDGIDNYQSSYDNIFVDNSFHGHIKIKVTLTPASYVSSQGKSERNLMLAASKNTEVSLELHHDKFNKFDDKALQVSYNDITMGYIQKKYENVDRTALINNFCFNTNILKKISLRCTNGVYFIVSLEQNKSKQLIDKKTKVNCQEKQMESEKLLEKLIQNTGWNIKK